MRNKTIFAHVLVDKNDGLFNIANSDVAEDTHNKSPDDGEEESCTKEGLRDDEWACSKKNVYNCESSAVPGRFELIQETSDTH